MLSSSVDRIIACESPYPSASLPIEQIDLQIHVYQYSANDTPEEYSNAGGAEGEEVMAATVCELPSKMWDGLWDSLIFSDDTKSRLLDYIYTTVLFSDVDVDCELLSLLTNKFWLIYARSQRCDLESSGAPARPARNGKDVPLPRACSKAVYPTLAQVIVYL